MHIIQMVNFTEEYALQTRLFCDLCKDGKDTFTAFLSHRGAVAFLWQGFEHYVGYVSET